MLPRQSLGHIQKHAGRSELPISPPDCTRLIRRLILILIYGTQALDLGTFTLIQTCFLLISLKSVDDRLMLSSRKAVLNQHPWPTQCWHWQLNREVFP